MTVSQARVATHFADTISGRPLAEIALRAGTSAPALTHMLQRMSVSGFINRIEHPRDARSVLVQLGETGEREFLSISRRLSVIDRELARRCGEDPEYLVQPLRRLASARGRLG